VPDQETEETQPYGPKAGPSSQLWEQRGRKKMMDRVQNPLILSVINHRQNPL
jgi:hypothetical protein